MLDDGSDPLVWPSALLLNVVALPAFALSSSSELRAWRWYHNCLAGFSLQSECDLHFWRFPGSSRYHCPLRNGELFV